MFNSLKKDAWLWISALVLMAVSGLLVNTFTYLAIPLFIGLIVAIFIFLFILEKPYIALVLIAFLLPFERIGAFDAGGFTVRSSQLVSLAMIVSWFLHGAISKKKKAARNPIIIPVTLFFAASVLSFSNAVNIERALIVFTFEVFVILMSIVVPDILRDKSLLKKVLVALFSTTLLVTLFGVYQFLGDMAGLPPEITGLREQYTKIVFGFPRVQSTALEPLYFGNFLLIPVSVGLALFLGLKKKELPIKSWLLGVILSLGVLNIVLTVSRGAYIGFAIVVLSIGFYYIKSFLTPRRFIPLVLALGIVVSGAFALFTIDEENLESFVGQATNITEGAGVVERFETYVWAIEQFEEHPLLGVGVGNYGPRIAKHPLITPDDGWLIVNNVYLEVLAERGIVGISAFFLILIFVAARSVKAIRFAKSPLLKNVMIGLLIAFTGIFVQYNTFSILYIFHVWFLIGLMVAVQNLIFAENEKNTERT